MIKLVAAKNFKGRSFEWGIAPHTIIVGPNGAGKSAIVQAAQLALEGAIPGVNKTNQAIIDAMGGDVKAIYAEVTVLHDKAQTKLGRQYEREVFSGRDSVKQVLMVDRRKTDAKGFAGAAATSGAPKIVAVDEFLAMSPRRMIAYLAGMIGNEDLDKLTAKAEDLKKTIKANQEMLRESESYIAKTSENLARLSLPAGSLAEVQAEIAAREKDLEAARSAIAEAKAQEQIRVADEKRIHKEEREASFLNEKNPQALIAQAALASMESAITGQAPRPHPADSIIAIMSAIKQANCPTCKGGTALLIAKRELSKWRIL